MSAINSKSRSLRVVFAVPARLGAATAVVGIHPTNATKRVAAPIALLIIRGLQGLALGYLSATGMAAIASEAIFS